MGQRGFHVGHIVMLMLLSLALMLGLFVLKLSMVERIAALTPAVNAAIDYDEEVHDLASDVLAMQGARRGFALTGDPLFQKSFEAARSSLHTRRARLERLPEGHTKPFDDAEKVLPQLLKLVAEYEAQLSTAMQARVERPDNPLEQERFTSQGEPLSRGIVETVLRMDRSIEQRLGTALKELGESSQRAERLEAGLFAAGLCVAVVGFALAGVEMRRRKEALALLDAANAGLEATVAQRTGDLERTEARWRSLVELSSDAIIACGPHRVVEYLNPAAAELLRRAGIADVLGRPIDPLFAGPSNAAVAQRLGEMCESPGRASDLPATLQLEGGTALPVQVSAATYADASGIRGQIVIHDVSELRAQEARLIEQLDLVEQLFDAIPAMISVRDPLGRYLRVNRALIEMRSAGAEYFVGRSVFDTRPYDEAHRLVREDARAMQSAGPIEYTVDLTGADGVVRPYLTIARALRGADGKLVGVLSATLPRRDVKVLQLNAELTKLSARLVGAQEEERRRISRELHDQVGQVLTALKIQLGALATRPVLSAAHLGPVLELADEALRHARDLTASLHPHLLEDLGLTPAVRWLVENLVRPSGLEVELHCDLAPPRGPKAIELVAFRVVQESLTNVVRHAQARKAWVRLVGHGARLEVEVRDDGQGASNFGTWFGTDGKVSVGVSGMRDRVHEAGGEFEIDGTPGAGTRVRASLPWEEA
jgi:two-component system, NarL family, sensor histidine kinase UhpB